jgi:hypothetical protein
MMDFQQDNAITFEIGQLVITARPALGGASLSLQMTGRPTRQYGIGATPLFGRLQFNAVGNASLPWPTFEFTQFYGQPRELSDGPEYFYFEGFLSYGQLEAFEKQRNGKDFSVGVRASLNVLNREGQVENWSIRDSHLHKTAQEWLTVLTNAGYKKYLLHEMAFPADASAKADSVYHHLLRARELFDKALYRECIGNLRLAEENLRNKRTDKDAIDQATKLFKGSKEERESMSLRQRMLLLRNSVNNALHTAPHHDEPGESFDRETAKALLVMVSALVELYPEPS